MAGPGAQQPTFQTLATSVPGELSAIAADGSLYFLDNSNTYKYSNTGAFQWQVAVGGVNLGIAPSGNVYVQTASSITALRPDSGSVLWTYSSGFGDETTPMAIDSHGTVYLQSGCQNCGCPICPPSPPALFTAINADGSQRWQIKDSFLPGNIPVVLNTDETIIYRFTEAIGVGGIYYSQLQLIDTNTGSVTQTLSPFNPIYPGAYAPWGKLYDASNVTSISQDRWVVWDPFGTNRYIKAYDSTDSPVSSSVSQYFMMVFPTLGYTLPRAIMDNQNFFYMANLDADTATQPYLTAYDTTTALEKWSYPLPSTSVSGPLLGGDGCLYVVSGGMLLKGCPSAGIGTISVTSTLPGVVFQLAGPGLTHYSGIVPFTVDSAPAGEYTIHWDTLLGGYVTPPDETQALTGDGSTTFNGNYVSSASLGSGIITQSGSIAEPINTATGNYYTSHTDLSVPGKGQSFNFIRYYNSLDSYTGPLGAGWTHSYNIALRLASGKVVIKEADGHENVFSAAGAGVYSPQTPGVFDSLQLNVDSSYTLTRKNQSKLNFSAAGQLLSIVDRNGNTQTLSYAGSNLTTVVDTAGRTFSFAYDGSNRLVALTDPIGRSIRYGYDGSGNLISIQDALGGTTQYSYDGSHRMISGTDPRGNVYLQNTYDAQGRVVAQANARSFVTTLAYDSPAPGVTTITDPLGNVTKHIHDASLRLVQVIDALGGSTNYTYLANNLKSSVTDPLGSTTGFTYDPNGNLVSTTDASGKVTSFAYNATNDLTQLTDRLGRITRFTYDANGNIATVVDAVGNVSMSTYTAAGQTATAKNARNFTTAFQYDSAGNLTKATDSLGGSVSMSYDGVGRLTSVQNQLGKTEVRAYDADNRLISVTDPLGNSTKFEYDPNGNLIKITDANGKQTQYAYDETNKLSHVTDAASGVTQYQYNGNTDLILITDAKGHSTAYAYDALRRLASVTDPLGRQKQYSYDADGNTTGTTDGNHKTNAFGYDVLNRLVSMTLSDGKNVSYTYDAVGNRLTMSDWRGTTTYSSDVLNRVTSITTPDGKTVGYSYDAVGNRATLIYPDGRVAHYTYDALNRLASVIDWANQATAYTYDAAGNLTGFAHPNGASSSYQYDDANRLLNVTNRSSRGVLSGFTYTLDGVGNRMQMATNLGGVNRYGYDALYRLTSWTAPSSQLTQWTYDAVGNRLSTVSSAGTTSYTYDAADQLLSAGTASYTYDGNGNQLTKTTGATTVNFGWDALNRLTSVVGGSINTHYQYDGDGNRVSQQVPTGTYLYANDTATALPSVLNENGPDGNIDYLYGSQMISATSSAFQYYYQFDGLGSAINITDQSGAQKANYTYDPWGKMTLVLDPLGTKEKIKFASIQVDSAGYGYVNTRYYDSSLGRFISRELLPRNHFLLGNPNGYGYARLNPVRLIDFMGLAPAAPVPVYSSSADLASLALAPTPTTSVISLDPAIGPAFRAELKGIIVDRLLFGDVGTFLRDLGLGVYDFFSPSVSGQQTTKQFETATESGIGVLSDKIGTVLDILHLLLVPEVAQSK